METICITPIDETQDIIWEIIPEKLYQLRFSLHSKIMSKGLRETQEATNINPMRLYYLTELPQSYKTRKTLKELADYFNIHISTYARESLLFT